MATARTSRGSGRTAVVLAVAVLVGLGLGRFATAGDEAPDVRTTTVRAAADLGERTVQLEQAVAADPSDWRSLQALGSAYADRAAESGDAAFYRLAADALARAERLQPGHPDTALAQGRLLLSLHAFDEALAAGQRAVAVRPDSAAALGVVVDAQVELGRYDDAARTLQDMLDRDPGLAALARTSYQRELRGDLAGAVATMRAAAGTSAAPADVAAVQALLGGLLLQTGDLVGAGEAYASALRTSPSLVAAQVGSARVQAAGGDVTGAVAALTDVTRAQPTVEGLQLLEQLQRATGDGAGAAATLDVVRSVALLAEDAGQVVDLEMALVEADRGDAARAVALATGAHAARPENVFTADALGWALLRSGDVARARPLLDAALRLGSRDPVLRWHAAEAAAATGDAVVAREHLAVVLSGLPWATAADPVAVRDLAGRLGVALPAAWAA